MTVHKDALPVRHPISRLSIATLLGAGLWVGTASAADLIGSGVEKLNAATITAGTGFASQDLCTRVMVSGDAFLRVKAAYLVPKVWPLPLVWDIDFQAGDRVSTRTKVPFLDFSRTSIYRAGLGCTIVPPGTSISSVRAQGFRPLASTPPILAPWPRGEYAAESQWMPSGMAATVARQGDRLFAETTLDTFKRQNTVAYLVAKHGRLVFERYAPGYNRSQPQIGWSMSKSLTSLIAGVMATDGRISLDAPVGIPQWTSDSRKAGITWRHLLTNAPGLHWFEGYEGASDTTDMLYSKADQGNWAANRPMESTPGTVFNYSTGFVNIAMLRMKQLLGNKHQAIYDYYQRQLFAPLGIRHGIIEPDASGTPVGGARGVLRPVDWLRLGQLVAQHGHWNGQQIISDAYMDFALAPSPADPIYGAYIWRLTGNDTEIPADVRIRLPADTVWFQGHLGQYVVIVPSRNLVVLRMGVTFDKLETKRRVMTAVADILTSGE